MRVALIDPSLYTLPYDAALAGGLAACGHAVSLYARQPRGEDGGTSNVRVQPVFYPVAESRTATRLLPRAVRLGLKGLEHAVSMTGLRRMLARERPDVIHFQWLPLPVIDRHFLAGLRRLAPLVLTVHDTNPFNGHPTSGLQRIGATAVWRHFERLIVHTAQGRDRLLRQGAADSQIVLAPHGLLGGGPAEQAADPMDGELTFLLFGKMRPYKGADLLIEAFARLPETLRQQARVRVVGKAYMDVEPLRALAAERGVADRVSLEPRFVADAEVGDLFGRGTIAAFPYREIEASGVLSLAIAHGRPILASRLGGFAETVVDGEHGLLVPPEDVSALAAAMERFLRDRDFAAACAARVQALGRTVPSWAEIGGRTAAVYADIARGRV